MSSSRLAEIIKAEPNPTFPGAVLVTIRCPLCGEQHSHGVPQRDIDGSVHYGHRVPHCTDSDAGDRGYVLIDPCGLVRRAALRRGAEAKR